MTEEIDASMDETIIQSEKTMPVVPPEPVWPEYVFLGHVSASTSLQIIVTGPCGAKEFRKLQKLLAAQIEVLEE